MHKLVIKGYYRVLQHRYTLDLMCWRCHGRSIPSVLADECKRKYLHALRLYRIFHLRPGFFIKSSPGPIVNTVSASIYPPYRMLATDSFFNTPANSPLGYVHFKVWFYLTPGETPCPPFPRYGKYVRTPRSIVIVLSETPINCEKLFVSILYKNYRPFVSFRNFHRRYI